MQRALTFRYLTALGLVAVMLLSIHVLQERTVAVGASDGHTINIAGRQRMLSQRIALLAREVHEADTGGAADALVAKLEQAVELMANTHRELLDPDGAARQSDRIDALYRSENGVDARMQRFIAAANHFIEVYRTNDRDSQALLDDVETLAAIARNGFLGELDAVVNAYEQEYETMVSRLHLMMTGALLLGFVLLLCEALFIFRPMVELVQRHIAALDRTNHELREFSYRISHDLRAPISSSIGLVSIAREAVNDEEWTMADTSLERVQSSMHRLDNLIDDVIEVTRVNQAAVAIEPVDLDALLNEIELSLDDMPNRTRAVITRDNSVLEPVSVKRVFLERLLQNLLSNALKYAKADDTIPRVHIRVAEHDGGYRIEVDDNGIGIPEAYQKDLFGLFKRFHPGVAKGSGLGLYLVQQYAAALDGRVTYTPLADGSRFTVDFATHSRAKAA